MLDEQAEQLGIDFAQHSPGIARAPRIEHALLLPQLDQQLDLLAQAQQHQRFGQTEQLGRHVGEHEAVAGQAASRSRIAKLRE